MANSVVSVIATAIEKQRKGYFGLSLSGMTTTSAPTIISGSVIEIGGSVYLYSADEAINATSWTAITTATSAYIELTPSGTSLTGAYTDNAPVWRGDYNGWYHSAGSSIRVVAGVFKTATAEHYNKYKLENQNSFTSGIGYAKGVITDNFKFTCRVDIGAWNMQTSDTHYVYLSAGTTINNTFAAVKDISAMIILDFAPHIMPIVRPASSGLVQYLVDEEAAELSREGGGCYDSLAFSSTAASRGYVTFELEEK